LLLLLLNFTPGIEGCLAWAECTLVEEISRKHYSLVIGKVVHLEVDERFFNEAGEMDYERAKPLSVMLGEHGMWFTRPVFAGRYADYTEMFLGKKDEAPAFTGETGRSCVPCKDIPEGGREKRPRRNRQVSASFYLTRSGAFTVAIPDARSARNNIYKVR
jgi:hypothetical protein